MNKNIIISILIVIGIGLLLVISKPKNNNASQKSLNSKAIQTTQSIPAADKIEVINFFGTQRCFACLAIGRLSKKTIEEKFADEVKSGKIVFKEINGELPENQDIVMKYRARGSSLFINAITGEKEDIEEDVTVWRLVGNEDQFKTYFEKKLKGLLRK